MRTLDREQRDDLISNLVDLALRGDKVNIRYTCRRDGLTYVALFSMSIEGDHKEFGAFFIMTTVWRNYFYTRRNSRLEPGKVIEILQRMPL